MSRPTPETDAIVRNAATADHPMTRLAATLTVKCEKLERERDEARDIARELRDALEFISKQNCRDKRMIAEMVAGMRKAARDALDKAWEVLP